MTHPGNECLTERHLTLFGAIVQWFASYEALMQEIMADVVGADVACIRLLTSGLNFGEKRAALHNLLRHRAIPLHQCERVQTFLRVPDTHSSLLHDILHSTWTPGKSSGSVQPDWILGLPPAVKPVHAEPDAIPGNFIERYEDRVSYTLDALAETVEVLAENHARFSAYLAEIRLSHGWST